MRAGAQPHSIEIAMKRDPPCNGSQIKCGWMVGLSFLTFGFPCRDPDLVHLGGAQGAIF